MKIVLIRYKNRSKQTKVSFQLSDVLCNILNEHKLFLKLKPISPFSTNPKPKIACIERLPNNFISRHNKTNWVFKSVPEISQLKKKIHQCIKHILAKPSKFCIDCFVKNYFDYDYNSFESTEITKKFKNSNFLNFEKHEFLIYGTEVPLFDSYEKKSYSDVVLSCKKHIFSSPQNPCDTCFWINYLRH